MSKYILIPEDKDGHRFVNHISEDRYIWFQDGGFDAWFVKFNPYGQEFSNDWHMFSLLIDFQNLVGSRVMSSMWSIFNMVPVSSPNHLFVIPNMDHLYRMRKLADDVYSRFGNVQALEFTPDLGAIAGRYTVDAVKWIEQMFIYIYYAMIAEENKKDAPCGKLVKMLGLYQALNGEFREEMRIKVANDSVEGLKSPEAQEFKTFEWTAKEVGGCTCGSNSMLIRQECKRRGIL